MPIGRCAFLDYNPVREDRETPKRLYRTIRWGQHLVELLSWIPASIATPTARAITRSCENSAGA